MVLFTFQYLFWGQELEHSVFLFTCSSLEISSENRVISYIVRKVWMRRLQRRWNRRKRFSNDGVIPRTSLSRWILRGGIDSRSLSGPFDRLECRWISFHSSRVYLRFSIISEGIWDVLEVKEWVSLVGFQGFRDL